MAKKYRKRTSRSRRPALKQQNRCEARVTDHAELLATIRGEGELSEDSDKSLTAILEAFAKSFA